MLAARDLRDPWWVDAPLEGPPLPRPVRVAVVTEPETLGGARLHSSVSQALHQTAGWRRRPEMRLPVINIASSAVFLFPWPVCVARENCKRLQIVEAAEESRSITNDYSRDQRRCD